MNHPLWSAINTSSKVPHFGLHNSGYILNTDIGIYRMTMTTTSRLALDYTQCKAARTWNPPLPTSNIWSYTSTPLYSWIV